MAPRHLMDTNFILLLLVIRQSRIGVTTPKDGGCFDFRMGVFPDLHTPRQHEHFASVFHGGVLTAFSTLVSEAAIYA